MIVQGERRGKDVQLGDLVEVVAIVQGGQTFEEFGEGGRKAVVRLARGTRSGCQPSLELLTCRACRADIPRKR